MNLFINAVSSSGMLILFDENRKIIAEKALEIKGNESSKLTSMLDDFITQNAIDYSNIDNIVVVHGPGSFTGVRAICLIVNTIAFSTNTRITPMSYFDLFKDFPILKQSSKRDMFIQKNSTSSIEIIDNESVVKYLQKNAIEKIYGECSSGWEGQIVEKIDYYDIISHVKFQKTKQVDPLYIKKPNIC